MTDRGGKVDSIMVGSYCSTFLTRIILKLYNIYAYTIMYETISDETSIFSSMIYTKIE